MNLTEKDIKHIKRRRRELAELAEIFAFAKEAGVDIDNATTDEILEGYFQTMLHAHGKNVQTMKAATKARDLESFNRVYIPAAVDLKTTGPEAPAPSPVIPAVLVELAAQMEKQMEERRERDRTPNIPAALLQVKQ